MTKRRQGNECEPGHPLTGSSLPIQEILSLANFVSSTLAGVYCFTSFSFYFVLPLANIPIASAWAYFTWPPPAERLTAANSCLAVIWLFLVVAPTAMSFFNAEIPLYHRLFGFLK